MQVITLLNEKGGVGKTTLAIHLAAWLAIQGQRVVLIDGDAQATATIGLGLTEEPCFYDLAVRNLKWQDALRVIAPELYALPDEAGAINGQLLAVPGNVETRNIVNSSSDGFVLLKRLRQLDGLVDYVIFDTGPTPSMLHSAIYAATDFILYPTLLEAWSFDGLRKSLAHREDFNPIRVHNGLAEIQILGIVPTQASLKTVEHSENLKALQSAFGDLVYAPIDKRILWAEAAAARRPVFSYAPGTEASNQAIRFLTQVTEALHGIRER